MMCLSIRCFQFSRVAHSSPLRGVGCLWLAMVLVTLFGAMFAPSRAAESPEATQQAASVLRLLDECQQNLGQLRQSLAEDDGNPLFQENATKEIELWQQLELVLVQRVSTHEELALIKQAATTHELDSTSVLALPRSYLEVDELREQRWIKRHELESLRNELQMEKSITIDVKDRFRDSEQLRRRLAEGASASGAAASPLQAAKLRLLRIEGQVLSNELDMHREQVVLLTARVATCERRLQELDEAISETVGHFTLSPDELDQRLSMIEGLELQVRDQLGDAEDRLKAIVLERKRDSGTLGDDQFEAVREESKLLQQLLAEANNAKECWRRRFELSNKRATAADITVWLEEAMQSKLRTAQISEKLRLQTSLRQQNLASLKRDEEEAYQLLAAEPESKVQGSAGIMEHDHLLTVYDNILLLAIGAERLYDRFIADLKASERQFSLVEWWDIAASSAVAIWNYEVTSIDDQSITVKKIACVIALLLVGYFLSSVFSRFVATRVVPKFGVSAAGAGVLRTVLHYSLLTGLTFMSLDIVNVPLTVFAFLGGAVAIGVGFGSQNLINNFISGIILLVERPIRIGDLVNVDGIDANVEHIGARSTRVRTGSNLEILIPNSKFLENNVTNWTLSDTKVRTSVSVGVAYGSCLRDVADTLASVVQHHEKVLQNPEPIILFQEFGDNALTFEVHFWIHQRRIMEGAKVRSDVRLAIDDAFKQAGIVIAFPQRDVHLDMASPLEIRLADSPQDDEQVLTQRFRRAV